MATRVTLNCPAAVLLLILALLLSALTVAQEPPGNSSRLPLAQQGAAVEEDTEERATDEQAQEEQAQEEQAQEEQSAEPAGQDASDPEPEGRDSAEREPGEPPPDRESDDRESAEQEPGELEPAEQEPADRAQGIERAEGPNQPSEPTAVTSEDGALIGEREGRTLWRLDFPEDSGGTGAVLERPEVVWVGHGNSLLLVDRATGRVQERHPMPGRVIRLEATDEGVSVVSDVNGNLRQRIEIGPEGPVSVVRFGTATESFAWLRREAAVEDPSARLEMDPTNPWLHLRAGLATESSSERQQRLEEAVARGSTFFDLAGLARALYEAGEPELAGAAMDRALQDFADRGYDPRLLTDADLHRAYDFPLAPMELALESGDMDAASFWAPWLYLLSSEEAPETSSALEEYSRRLAAQGQRDAATLWRERAGDSSSASPAASLDRFFFGLGRAGWYGVAALLAAIVALHLTLIAKYWLPHSLAIRRSRETGGARRPWSRVFAIRYYSFTEKLVLVLLFASCLALIGLTHWYDSSGGRPPALESGTLASPAARDMVTSIQLEGQRAAFIRGFAAHTADEPQDAEAEYRRAGDYPPALNNLGALSGDEALYRRALELAPGTQEAAFNLGRRASPSPFHAAYRANEPLLAVPGSGDFRTATAGSWQRAVASTFENPWRSLRGVRLFDMPGILWQIVLALFLIWILVTLVWLFIPRPGFARNAPRTVTYHLLALLIPGSGLADEAWGLLLMVPWALLGVDALAQWLGWSRSLGLALDIELLALGAIYLVNFAAFIVEFISYRKRMRTLRRRSPEAFEAYGLRGD